MPLIALYSNIITIKLLKKNDSNLLNTYYVYYTVI